VEQVRCFIAIGLTDEIKAGLEQLQSQLKSGGQTSIKWVDPYNIHLTLKFLGGVDGDKISPITAAMAEAVQGVTPFRLEVKGLGVFPSLRRVQVVWVGVGGEVDKLAHLQQRLESSLAGLGFTPENRRFTPHLTLARVHDRASSGEREGLGELIAGTKFETAYSFPVEAVSLMKSQLTREGAIYSRISAAALK
jgi:RNA 2',3'-cyclic 3'-phosphodiesterase